MFELITTNRKILIGAVVLVSLSAVSYYAGKGQQKVVVEEKVVEKIVTKEVETKKETVKKKTKIVEKSDGSKETTINESTTAESESSKDSSSTKLNDKTKTTTPVSKYKLSALANFDSLRDKPDLSLGAGVRAVGLVWIDGSYRPKTKTFSVGVSLEL